MNKERVIEELQSRYPGKTIIQLPQEGPKEIICEVQPTSEHLEYSVAIAVIDESRPHIHNKSVETYEVLSGEIEIYVNREKRLMKERESHVIQQGVVHWAKANAALVRVSSEPGWTPEDHILVDNTDYLERR